MRYSTKSPISATVTSAAFSILRNGTEISVSTGSEAKRCPPPNCATTRLPTSHSPGGSSPATPAVKVSLSGRSGLSPAAVQVSTLLLASWSAAAAPLLPVNTRAAGRLSVTTISLAIGTAARSSTV